LDSEPNIEFLGHPLNAYHLIRHVSTGWNMVRNKTSLLLNETAEIFSKIIKLLTADDLSNFAVSLKEREQRQQLPDFHDIEGAAFGISRYLNDL